MSNFKVSLPPLLSLSLSLSLFPIFISPSWSQVPSMARALLLLVGVYTLCAAHTPTLPPPSLLPPPLPPPLLPPQVVMVPASAYHNPFSNDDTPLHCWPLDAAVDNQDTIDCNGTELSGLGWCSLVSNGLGWYWVMFSCHHG